MADEPAPEGVTTNLDTNTASASGVVDASPAEVFDYIRRPANHPEISGDHSVRGTLAGPDQLGPESRFGMKMKVGVPYRMKSKVVEFDEDRVIAWCHIGGHRWRWELEPDDDGKTKVTETFDMSTSKFPPVLRMMGYPKGHVANVATSIANVQKHFAS
jgi:uncharacterized protein YndB with AHSA1/START domain